MKDIIRSEYLAKRKSIADKGKKSHIIAEKVKADEHFLTASVVAVYKSLPFEVGTEEIIRHALTLGKTVALPKVCGDDLLFYKITEQTAFGKSDFGVLEPAENGDRPILKSAIELAIVPGMCFDRARSRLGFGKGFYDRFLRDTDIYKLAIAFDEQIIKDGFLPADEYDVNMDRILTETKVL